MKEETKAEIERIQSTWPEGLTDVWQSLAAFHLPAEGDDSFPTVPDDFKCPKCHDSGWIRFSKDGYDFVQECDCVKADRARKRIERSGLKNLLESYTFSTYKAEEPWQERVLKKARLYVDTLLAGEQKPPPWFFIGGNAGAGKTHICTAICGELLNAGKRVVYMQWVTDARALKAVITEQDEFDARIAPLISCDVLYIDDLFKSRGLSVPMPSEADLRLAYQIINARYASGLPTIISCEWHLRTELIDVDEATFSRVVQRCGTFFDNSLKRDRSRNYRLKKAPPKQDPT